MLVPVGSSLRGHEQGSGSFSWENPFKTLCSRVQDQETREGAVDTSCIATVCSDATIGVAEDLLSLMLSVGWSRRGRRLRLRQRDQSSAFQGDGAASDLREPPSRGSQSAQRGQARQILA